MSSKFNLRERDYWLHRVLTPLKRALIQVLSTCLHALCRALPVPCSTVFNDMSCPRQETIINPKHPASQQVRVRSYNFSGEVMIFASFIRHRADFFAGLGPG